MKKIIFLLIGALLVIPAANAASYDVVISRGDFPVDTLVAQIYTQSAGIPLITVGKTALSDEVEVELYGYRVQGYKNALIIGGESAVSRSIEDNLKRLNFTVTRLWDWNRYGTAARVGVSLWEESNTVVVAPADRGGVLVSAARIAIDFKSPLLLTGTGSVPEETKKAITTLGANRIILVGNVSESVKGELAEIGGLQPTEQTQITIVKQTSNTKGLFVIGIIIGALVIFLISSLFSVGVFGRKRAVPYDILNQDERKIIGLIEKSSGSVKQEELPRLTGFSRPKITRITHELEERDIIEKKKSGKTYVLILKRLLK